MSLPTLLGFVIGIALFLFSIALSTDNYFIFFHLTGLTMVLGGTTAATFVAFEPRYVLQAFKVSLSIFFQQKVGRAMLTGEVGPGDSVAVFGCGGVGCAAVAGARLAGAAKVIAIDLDPGKLDQARAFGATDVVDASTSDVVAAVQALTGGHGADVCIEAVGNPQVMEQAFYARDLAGTLVQVGVPTPDMRIDLPMIDFFGRGGQLRPSWYGDCLPSRDFPLLVDLYLQGRLDLDRFVSETIALEDVEAAFHRMERGEVLRSVVVI